MSFSKIRCGKDVFFSALLGFVAFCSLSSVTLPAAAQTVSAPLPPPVIGVMDFAEALTRSVAWKDLTGKIEARRGAMQTELSAEQAQIQNDGRDLASQQSILDPGVFAEKQNELRARAGALQKKAREEKNRLDQLFLVGRGQIQRELIQVANELATELGINIMLNFSKDDQSVLFVNPELILTNIALTRLDAVIQTVDLAGN